MLRKKPQLAIEAWTEVLALDGDHEAALAALERLYLAGEAHALLADIYARRAAQNCSTGAKKSMRSMRAGQARARRVLPPACASSDFAARISMP